MAAVQRGDVARQRGSGSSRPPLLGGVFLGFQVYEFSHFVHEGLDAQQNLFGSTFFVLTGFHGGHVTMGVIWLGWLSGTS